MGSSFRRGDLHCADDVAARAVVANGDRSFNSMTIGTEDLSDLFGDDDRMIGLNLSDDVK